MAFPNLARLLLLVSGCTVAAFACASAVEPMGESARASQVAAHDPTVLGYFEGHASPDLGLMIQPSSNLSHLSSLFFSGSASATYLASVTPTVGLVSGWSTATFDTASNTISTHSGSGSCLKNNSGNAAYGMRVYIWNFSDQNVIGDFGATSDGSGFRVDFNDMPDQATFCRPFALTNTSASSYNFGVAFLADSLSKTDPKAYISSAPTRWTLDATGNASFTVSGFGLHSTSALGAKETLFLDGTDVGTVDIYPTHVDAALNGFVGTDRGVLTIATESNGTVTGPYIFHTPKIRADLKLPAGSGTKTGTLFWGICDDAAGACYLDIDGCPIFPLVHSERQHNVTLTDAVDTAEYMNTITWTGNAGLYMAFDMNGDRILNAGDRYDTLSILTISAGTLTDTTIDDPYFELWVPITATCASP